MAVADILTVLRTALADRYSIEQEIGRGGMGAVYSAHDLKHDRPVAIKVLDPEIAASMGHQRFVREIRDNARLNHPHIVPLYDSGSVDGVLFYVMPLAAGQTLRERLDHGPLTVDQALKITNQLVSALDFAHKHGIVHRDVKPENVLVVGDKVQLADFGIAKAIDTAGGIALTTAGGIIGTPAYMSPEQATGGSLDARTDQYSLGIMLYEMLTGTTPFAGPRQAILHQVLSQAPRPITELRPTPEPVAQAIHRAIEKKAEDRFPTLAQFANALDELPETVQVVSPSSRKPGVAMGVIAVVTAVVLVVGALVWIWSTRNVADSQGRPRNRILIAAFDGPADDPEIATAVRDLVADALERSSVVAPIPDEYIQDAVVASGKPRGTRVDNRLAHELAYRGSVRAVIEGRVTRAGSGYALLAKVMDVDSSRTIASLSETATDQSKLIAAATRLSRRLRVELGERPEALRATHDHGYIATPSLEAARAYARAHTLMQASETRASLAKTWEAVRLDSAFARAWGLMSGCYLNLAENDSALFAVRKALSYQERLNEAYVFSLQAREASLKRDHPQALEAYGRSIERDPQNTYAYNNRCHVFWRMGRWQEALRDIRTANQLPFGSTEANLRTHAHCAMALGRIAEAESAASKLRRWRQLVAIQLGLAKADWTRLDTLSNANAVAEVGDVSTRVLGTEARAVVEAVRGRVAAARKSLELAHGIAERERAPFYARRSSRHLVLLELVSHGRASAHDPAARDTTPRALTRAMRAVASGNLATAEQVLRTVREWKPDVLFHEGVTPDLVQAMIDIEKRNWNRATSTLQPLTGFCEPGDVRNPAGAIAIRWALAKAFEGAGHDDSAAVYLESALVPPADPTQTLVPRGLVHSFVHRQLVVLYSRMGRVEDARRHWTIFQRDFTHPDPDLIPLVDEAKGAFTTAERLAASR